MRRFFCSVAGSSGVNDVVQIWPWGWGFEQPIAEPLFSKICMYFNCGPVVVPF